MPSSGSFVRTNLRVVRHKGYSLATILHLSDLHLGVSEANKEFGDHKLDVIDPAARQTRSSTLHATLQSLARALTARGEQLDAVVVSGDVTYQGHEEGFALLGKALGHLGDLLPDPSRIVVVPGNHDVSWFTRPGTPERYRLFLQGVRKFGFVTPLLEGVDVDATGTQMGTVSPTLVATDSSFVVVALNSADHCGVVSQVDPELEAHIQSIEARASDAEATAVLNALKRSSIYDIARVGDSQRRFAGDALRDAINGLDGNPVRIAVMHHQLLPIALDEEIKPFESLANLAQVRDWLALNDVDLVLHGHKHVAVAYEDMYVPLAAHQVTKAADPRRVIVSSVGTVGMGQPATNCVARLIRFDPSRSSLGKFQIVDIPGVQPGTPLVLNELREKTFLTRVAPNHRAVIEGETSHAVHEQLLERLDRGKRLPHPLVCHVVNPKGAGTMPSSYKQLESVPQDEQWFTDLVGLWQNPQRLSAMTFNHGERIFAMRGIDQFDGAIRCLTIKDTSSRAVITLFDHERDDIKTDIEFPAFCLVQLFVVDNELCIVGYFRKQEMRYWWAVNLAELAELQRRAVERLNVDRGNSPVRPGKISTVTAIPTAGSTVPRVAVPLVDRWVDEDPYRLTRMALVVFDPSLPAAADALADWETTVEACRPRASHAADGDPVPVRGLEKLKATLRGLHSAYAPNTQATTLDGMLQRSATANAQYLDQGRGASGADDLKADLSNIHQDMAAAVAQLREATAAAGEAGRS